MLAKHRLPQAAALAAVLLMGAQYGEHLLGKTWRFRQKLTVTVQTPTGVKVASSVTQWKASQSPLGPSGGMGMEQTGEAAFVEIAPGKYLFALLGKPHPVLAIWSRQQIGSSIEDELERLKTEKVGGPVRSEEYPMLVTFSDNSDPASVREVKPDRLGAAFGEGFRISSITIETTDEAPTRGAVEKALPWLRAVWPNKLDGSRIESRDSKNRFANSLEANSFSTHIRR